MQDPFSQEHFIDDFKNKQIINAIFFSNEAHHVYIENGSVFLEDDEYLYKQDISNTSNTGSTSSEKTKDKKRKKISPEKKKIILEKNRESARQSRRRKKQIIESLLKENRELKRELHEFKKHLFVTLCKDCKAKLNLIPNKPIIQQSVPQVQSRKPFSLFTVCAAVICIILNIAYFSDFFSTSSNPLLRKLSNRSIVTYQEIEKINITVGSVFISYGDYYSIINGKQFLRNEVFYTFENKGKVRKLYNKEIGQVPVTECPSCMVEIPRSNIVQKKGKIGFKLFVNPTRFWEHKSNNDTLDNDVNTLLELDCETIGYSKHIMNIHNDFINDQSSDYIFVK